MKPVPLVAAGAVVVLLAVFIYAAAIDEHRNAALASQALARGQAWRETVARERQQSERNRQQQAARLRQLGNALAVANALRDTIQRADTLPAPDTSDAVASHWHAMFQWQVIRADSLTAALDASQSAFLLARQDAARAWRTVDSGVVASRLADEALRQRQCRIAFFACPSRGVMLVAGLVIGGAIMAKVGP